MAALVALFEADPGVGFSIVDLEGVILHANRKAAELFLGVGPDDIVGKRLGELYGDDWADERLRVMRTIHESGRPMIMRHIRRGVRLQSTIRPLSRDGHETPAFSVVTVEGEVDPPEGSDIGVFESSIADLGPLALLTKRELEVLALIGHGMRTQDIAKAMFRAPKTIERHCESLRAKLHASNRVELAAFALAAGLRLSDADAKRTDPLP